MNETSKKSIVIVANLVYGKTEKFCFCPKKFVKMNGVLHCLAEIKTNFHEIFLNSSNYSPLQTEIAIWQKKKFQM